MTDEVRTETPEDRAEDLAEDAEAAAEDNKYEEAKIDAMIRGIDVAQATRDFAKAHTVAALRAEMLQALPSLAAEIADLTAGVRHYSPKAKVPRFEIAGAERLDLGDLAALKARGDALADVLDDRLAALEAETAAAAEASKTEIERLRERIHALENPPPPRLGTLPRHLTYEFKDALPPMCGGFPRSTPGPVRDLAAPRGSTQLIGRVGRATEPLPPMLTTPKRHRLGAQPALVSGESYGVD